MRRGLVLTQTADAIHAPPETSRESESYPTIEAVSEQRRQQALAQKQSAPSQSSTSTVAIPDESAAVAGSPEGLEEEASQEGAFNEETGEINWDCPCLGGMAHGPCGEQFKAAFSCFVYSKEEPKGVDCIEHFKTMQNCFREHPEMYGSELEPDEEDLSPEGAPLGDGVGQAAPVASQSAPAAPSDSSPAPSLSKVESPHGRGEKVSDHTNATPDSNAAVAGKHERAEAATQQVKRDHEPLSESDAAVPKAAHDAR